MDLILLLMNYKTMNMEILLLSDIIKAMIILNRIIFYININFKEKQIVNQSEMLEHLQFNQLNLLKTNQNQGLINII